MNHFSVQLRYLRKKHGLNQIDLGNKLGVGKSTVSMWESGQRVPDFGTIEKIAAFFDVDISIFSESSQNKAPTVSDGRQDDASTAVQPSGLHDTQYDNLTPKHKSVINHMIATLLESQSED